MILNGRPESNLQLTIGEIKRIVQFPTYESLLFEITFISFINVYIYMLFTFTLLYRSWRMEGRNLRRKKKRRETIRRRIRTQFY